ncbi:hypothetical protein HHK36_007965 [Tetracentron sinense]|uniref:Uncharacterized protein n=1 Tax=Tetracentron sinense TaxID=13715 RepID=A0A835DMT0_TETSI|nr:hypothetical protein HHK36_007965 [Tetracentron sinense]
MRATTKQMEEEELERCCRPQTSLAFVLFGGIALNLGSSGQIPNEKVISDSKIEKDAIINSLSEEISAEISIKVVIRGDVTDSFAEKITIPVMEDTLDQISFAEGIVVEDSSALGENDSDDQAIVRSSDILPPSSSESLEAVFGLYPISPDFQDLWRKIVNRYGDITNSSVLTSPSFRAVLVDAVCSVVTKVQNINPKMLKVKEITQ